jgi:hypothetical protein
MFQRQCQEHSCANKSKGESKYPTYEQYTKERGEWFCLWVSYRAYCSYEPGGKNGADSREYTDRKMTQNMIAQLSHRSPHIMAAPRAAAMIATPL